MPNPILIRRLLMPNGAMEAKVRDALRTEDYRVLTTEDGRVIEREK